MFFVVFFVSILGLGLFMTALLHPNSAFDWVIILRIFLRPYVVLFGETGIADFDSKDSF